jgi:filamentous hemagglutinin family protein
MNHHNLSGFLNPILRAAQRPPHDRWLAGVAGALSAIAPALALANPTGGHVVAGTATIGAAGNNGVIVNQGSQRAAINWQQFSIGSNEYVQFNQPNSSSVVLNRVTGSNPSSIFGQIHANGQVFLINPNGILFAPGSSLDVSGLTASTLDISDADFMAGRYVFSRDPGASAATVVNQGNITVTPGGYVVLAGDYAENDGVIQAESGKVLLAAGGGTTLTLDNSGGLISFKIDAPTLARLAGVSNAGSIVANGGSVVMTADVANALTATAVNNSGFITAHSVRQQGGEIMLLSQGGGIENSGTLDASASQIGASGGSVILHGDARTRLTDTSVIDTAGDGAKGGFIDVSGHELNLRGMITAGKGGTLLLDPLFVHIISGAGNTTSASTNNVGVGFIDGKLAAGSNLTLTATDSIVNLGHVARAITSGPGTGNLTLQTNDGTIDLTGLAITIKGSLDIQAAAGSGGIIQMNGATAKAISLHGSTITVAGALTATSGGISVTGRTSRDNHTPAFSISGAMHATGRVLVSYSNEGGVPTGYLNMKDVTGGTIKIVGEKIVTGNLTATGTGINAIFLSASGSFGGTSQVNPASIQVNGSVKASNSGGVFMRVKQGTGIDVTGNVTAKFSHASLSASNSNSATHILVGGAVKGPEINITAKGASSASVHVGNVTASKFDVNITAKDTSTSSAQVAKITTGNLAAAKNVTLTASGGNIGGAQITTGGITAYTSTCGSGDCNGGGVNLVAIHGSVMVGGNILVTASKALPGNVTINAGNISFVGITAVHGSVDINEDSLSSVGVHNITQTGGTIKARFINVDLHASYGGVMTLNNLTASSSRGSAGISLQAEAFNGGVARIVVNGNINVSGVGASNASTFNGFHNAGISSHTPVGEGPTAAFLNMAASGDVGHAHTIKVNGTINVTGHAGNFNSSTFLHSCECGTVAESGKAGLAQVSVQASGSGGSVQLLGATTVKAPDALVTVSADRIKTAALNVTASGHTLALNVTRTSGTANHATLASNNTAGRATIVLQGSSGSAAGTITTGNITVSGKGSANLALLGQAIVAGNVTVTATAAQGTRHLTGAGTILQVAEQNWIETVDPGMFGLHLGSGSYDSGRAAVVMADSHGGPHTQPPPAQSIKLGNVSVTGVGSAEVDLSGALIQVGSINAVAAGGSMKGTFTSSNEAGVHHETFTFKNEGEAQVELDTGAGTGTAITVTGGISVKGPTANISLDGHTVKVSKGLSATGLGGQATFSSSGTGGGGFTEKFTGPGPITSVSIGGVGSHSAASINVGGIVSVKGPGIVGIAITGAKVTLGGLSASASAAETYKVVDSQDGENLTFTADSAAILVFQTSNGKPGGGPATIDGDVTVTAPHGNVAMLSQLNVTGQVKITAGKDVSSDPTTVISRIKAIGDVTGHGSGSGSSQGTPSATGLQLKLKAAGVSMVAGGSIDLTGANVTTSGVLALKAGTDIILSGVTLNTGTLAADAGSTIHNGGATGTITTKALALVAGKNINLSSTNINVGSGVVIPVTGNAALTAMFADPAFAAAVTGDPILLGGLAAAGLSPAASGPNAVFKAGNSVTLGTLNLTGSYLYLQANNVSLLGPVTVPKGTVVQFLPNGLVGTIDAEGSGAAGATLNLNDTGLFNLFPDGITLVLGGAGQTGAVTLGSRGTFNIGSDNLIVYTTGSITSLGNVISTGQVVSLASLLTGLPPVTAGEIDPTSSTTTPSTDKDKQGQDADANGTGEGAGGTISQDSGTSSVCH